MTYLSRMYHLWNSKGKSFNAVILASVIIGKKNMEQQVDSLDFQAFGDSFVFYKYLHYNCWLCVRINAFKLCFEWQKPSFYLLG